MMTAALLILAFVVGLGLGISIERDRWIRLSRSALPEGRHDAAVNLAGGRR